MISADEESHFVMDEKRISELELRKALRLEQGLDLDLESVSSNPLVVTTLTSGHMSLLHLACHLGSLSLVKALLDREEENVNCVSGDGLYPIHILCSNIKNVLVNQNILELLLQHDFIDVNVRDSHGRTALNLACCNNLVHSVKSLIEAGCLVNIPDKDGNTPFSASCRLATEGWYFWDTDCLNDDCGYSSNQCDFPAVLICRELLKAGAHPKTATLLPSAILYGSVDIVKEFLRLGVNVNAMDENRRTPLGCACSTLRVPPSMVRLLLKAGADVNENVGEEKSKPIILAFVHNSIEKIWLLLSYGAIISTEQMSELVSASLSKFLKNPELIDEECEDLLPWRLLIKAGFRSQLDMYILKLLIKRVYLCSSYYKVSKTINSLLFPLNSLSDMCRITIRSQIALPIHENVDQLPVPNRLKDFLNFYEFCSKFENN